MNRIETKLNRIMTAIIYAASGPLHYSLHLHIALGKNTGLLWPYRKVLQKQLEL